MRVMRVGRIENPRGFSFISFIQLCLLLIIGMVVFIGLMFFNSDDWDPTSGKNFVPSNVAKERNKVNRNEEDINWLIGKIQNAIDNPIPELHTGLRGFNKPENLNLFGVKIIEKKEVPVNIVNTMNIVQQKPKQKMIRYEDWVDEVEVNN